MRRILLLLLLLTGTSAQAGLFSDDEARKQIQQMEDRILKLSERVAKQDERAARQEDALRQQTRSLLDLQGQIDAINTELRKLHGINEELSRGLQDAEKREKDFYVDLDTRLRRLEDMSKAAKSAENSPAPALQVDPNDPVTENRSFEAAYGFFKSGSHASAVAAFQDFLKKYPDSAHAANATYWLGSALFALNDYNGALRAYRSVLGNFPGASRTADALFNIAGCQQELKQSVNAQRTLKQLISKYPTSEAAAKARKLIASGGK